MCCSVLQCVTVCCIVCCSVLLCVMQCVGVCCSVSHNDTSTQVAMWRDVTQVAAVCVACMLQSVAVCCSVFCSVLQCIAACCSSCCSVLHNHDALQVAMWRDVTQVAAVCVACVLQCVEVCCSVFCSVLHCIAACCSSCCGVLHNHNALQVATWRDMTQVVAVYVAVRVAVCVAVRVAVCVAQLYVDANGQVEGRDRRCCSVCCTVLLYIHGRV